MHNIQLLLGNEKHFGWISKIDWLWLIFAISNFLKIKICKNQPNQSFDFIFSHFHWFYWIPRVFSSENTPTRYFTIFVPLKSQANFKMSPNFPKFLINDVIPEVVIIFRLRNLFFGFSDHFYVRISLTIFS